LEFATNEIHTDDTIEHILHGVPSDTDYLDAILFVLNTKMHADGHISVSKPEDIERPTFEILKLPREIICDFFYCGQIYE